MEKIIVPRPRLKLLKSTSRGVLDGRRWMSGDFFSFPRLLTVLERRRHNFLRHGTGSEGVERLNDHAVTRELLQVRQMMLAPGHGRSCQTQSDARRRDPSFHGFIRVLLRPQPEFREGVRYTWLV